MKKEETAEFTKDDAVDLFNELMANKQDEIVQEVASETAKAVAKEIPALVKAEFEKLKDSSNNDEEEEENNDEEEEEEETNKNLKELIASSVDSAVEKHMGKLFKNLNDNRDPEFNVDKVDTKNLDNPQGTDDEDAEKGLSSREIAEKMFGNQTQDDYIRSLLG